MNYATNISNHFIKTDVFGISVLTRFRRNGIIILKQVKC